MRRRPPPRPSQLVIFRPADGHADLGGGGHGLHVGEYLQQVEVAHSGPLEPTAPKLGVMHPGVGT